MPVFADLALTLSLTTAIVLRKANGCGTEVEYTFEGALREQIHLHSNGGALFFQECEIPSLWGIPSQGTLA